MRRTPPLGDAQPMLAAIAKTAARLCDANDALIFLTKGDQTRLVARYGRLKTTVKLGEVQPLTRHGVAQRAILERRTIHVRDLTKTARAGFVESRTALVPLGVRTMLATPLLRDGAAIGAIIIRRTKVRPFTPKQIALLRTFADQAAIAIENARLSQALEARNADLTEALNQKTATSEILRVISNSPTDVQPVLEAVAASAERLCEADLASVFRFDGTLIHHAAQHGRTSDEIESALREFPQPPHRGSVTGRALLVGDAVQIADVATDPEANESLRIFRTVLSVPMIRDGQPLGAITVARRIVRPFTDGQVALLQTFADQAVIAIENVRLFTELESRNSDLRAALEQQTATSEILGVISSSPTDEQPVFDAIVQSARRLCEATFSVVFLVETGHLTLAAVDGVDSAGITALHGAYPRPVARDTTSGRAILDRRIVHLEDSWLDPEYTHPLRDTIALRSILTVPIFREGLPLGALSVWRGEVRPFTDKQIALLQTFADQAVIALENVRLFKELEARNRDLTVALEQQTATSEILRVISSSPTDVQPIFDAIASSATRLCDAAFSVVFRFDGEMITVAAGDGRSPGTLDVIRSAYPSPPGRHSMSALAILERRVICLADAQVSTEYPQLAERARAIGYRSILVVPMLRGDVAIGTINVARLEAVPFTEKQIALLQTFADQAVIAIENVRLFKELETRNGELTEALGQQTATSEILRVISSSPTDVQPVFDTIARSAVRLCDGMHSAVTRLQGGLVHLVASHNWSSEGLAVSQRLFPMPPDQDHLTAHAIRDNRIIHIHRMQDDPAVPATSRRLAIAQGYQTLLIVPIRREGQAVGAIIVAKAEGPFSESQVELLKTFADQAVIAIENVRLFTELEVRNRDLTVALEQQTATSEILRVISQSPTDVQPVFDTIGERAERLCAADVSVVSRFDGAMLQLVALHGLAQEGMEAVRGAFPMRPSDETISARAFRSCSVIHVPDVLADALYETKGAARAGGYHGCLGVPMVREGQVIGVIFVARTTPGYFTDSQVELLKTFADQAVIAVENVRLFKELQARTGELTQSVEKLTALGEVSRAVSSTLDVETVLDTIVSRASQLAGAAACAIFEYDEGAEQFALRATYNYDAAFVEALRAAPLRKGEGLMGRAAEMREPVQVSDITQPGAYQSSLRDTLIQFGYRALLSVPLLREDQIIGSLSFNRKVAGEFPPEVIEVLKTFATQSALAIQNARLFREIADKSRQLEVASRHKSEFLANMSHELRTPLNAIIGFSEVLNERMFGELNEKQEEYLKDIHASGQHLLSLINDILDLSKIEAGRMELELTDFDLPAAVDNAVTLVRERASRKGVTVRIAVREQVGMIRGDERKIRQVLLNLLSNAIKFTPEGGRIEVAGAVEDGAVEVSVSDTGVGIAPEDQEAVFEEFRQVGASPAKQEGTGLGLALSRKFIELHGGTIRVESTIGAGSTFTFRLPTGQ